MSVASTTQSLIDEFRSRPTVRAGSLITTVFGDSVAPRGGSVWLGSLIRVMREFGINERLVRTSVFRLSRDGWFGVSQVGRRSYYSLSDEGARKFEKATKRIYSEPVKPWPGDWCLLLLGTMRARQKEWLRKETAWLGFAAVSNNVLAHPAPDMADIEPLLKRKGIRDQLVILRARTLDIGDDAAVCELVRRSWNLDEIDRRYQEFVRGFRPVFAALRKSGRVEPADAFKIRTLLIQEYRKVLLRDPVLPAELLPAEWHGTIAYRFCRDLYLAVHEQADDWLSRKMETVEGPLPMPDAEFYERFGGLER